MLRRGGGTHHSAAGGPSTAESPVAALKVAPSGDLLELAPLGRPGPSIANPEASLPGKPSAVRDKELNSCSG